MVMLVGEEVTLVDIGLFAIFLIVLIAPFKVKMVEKNLEAFLFVMGAAAVTITSKWFVDGALNMELISTAAEEPIIKGIVPAVLVAGLIFFYGQKQFQTFHEWPCEEDEPRSNPIRIHVCPGIDLLSDHSHHLGSVPLRDRQHFAPGAQGQDQLRSDCLFRHWSWRSAYSSG